jgi:hypothetical protein
VTRIDKSQNTVESDVKPLDTSSLFADFKPEEVVPPEKPYESPKPKKSRKVVEIQPQEPPIVCGEDEANALLDVLQPICSMAASRIYGVDSKITSRAFQFTPDHRKRVNPPLIRVMNKWLPSMVKRWSDEIGLAIVLGAVVNSQIKVMQMLDAGEKQRISTEKSNVKPISTPVVPPVETSAEQTKQAGD